MTTGTNTGTTNHAPAAATAVTTLEPTYISTDLVPAVYVGPSTLLTAEQADASLNNFPPLLSSQHSEGNTKLNGSYCQSKSEFQLPRHRHFLNSK